MSKLHNSVMGITFTLKADVSSKLSDEGKEQACQERAVDVEAMIKAALKAGAFKPSRLRVSQNGNLTSNTGSIQVDLITTDKPVKGADKEKSEVTEQDAAKALGL